MSKYSTIVLWLGLFMIALNLFKSWSVVKQTIFQGANSTPAQKAGPGLHNLPQIKQEPIGSM